MITTDGHCDVCGEQVPINTMHSCAGGPPLYGGGSTTWPTAEQKEAIELADYRKTQQDNVLEARLATLEAQVAQTASDAARLRTTIQQFAPELERLAALVKEGFYEGWNVRLASGRSQLSSWNVSTTRRKLEGGHPSKTLAEVFAAEAAEQANQKREGE